MYEPSSYLAAALLAILAGPAVFFLVRDRQGPFRFLDGFVVLAVPALVFLHVVPEAVDAADPWLVAALVAGLLAPGTLERVTRDVGHRTDRLALVLGVSGLALHTVLEGAAVSALSGPGDLGLGLAIVIHRLPVGLAVWWLVRDVYGDGWGAGAVLGLAAMTGAGFAAGEPVLTLVGGRGVELYTAFVGGTLVHVVFHQIGHHVKPGSGKLAAALEGMGAVLAMGVFLLPGLIGGEGEAASVVAATDRFLVLAAESAPALLLAYLFAGLLQGFLPGASMRWVSRGGSLSSAARGMAVGLPFPICSCGVVPLYRTLVQRGAPASAGMAFLVATPELGLDAVMLSIPLLGPQLTVVRVVVAAVAALLVGWLVGGRLGRKTALPVAGDGDGAGEPLGERLVRGLRSGFGEVVDHTAPWIILGLIIAAVCAPLLESGWLTTIPPMVDVLVFAVLGFPVYVCASSATPLVATLVAAGLSPGAAIAFLITGPATNVTTFGVVASLYGRRAALAFSATLVAISVSAGLLINGIFGTFPGPSLSALVEETPGPLHQISLVLLGLLVLSSLLRRGFRRFVGELRLSLGDGHHHVKVVG
jgi:uncharacterized membrane protein YraQ (UPF0718 family)